MIHAHAHNAWSRLDGTGSADKHAETAANLGMPALASTNHGTLSGALHHIRACNKYKIMPICGIEAYYKVDHEDTDEVLQHICFHAKNLKGWHSLLRLSTEAYESRYARHGPSKYAMVNNDLMRKHAEGVICSTACLKSPLAQYILAGDMEGATQFATFLQNVYGDDLFFEIMPHDIPEQVNLNIGLANLGTRLGVPVIATTDAHYPTAEDFETYRIAGFMNTKMTFSKLEKKKAEGKNVLEFDLPSLYLMSDFEVKDMFAQNHTELSSYIVDEAVANTHEFASRISPFFLDRSTKMPDVKSKVPEPRKVVMEWVKEGMERIGKLGNVEYSNRLEFEIDELDKREDVYDYFYIVGEAVRWAKENKIRVGLGRGSAAGCLISYLVGITDIDPIAYGLLFERFLNPNRRGMPDIDIDFSSKGRQRVKDHLADVWGHDHVADIIAHQTFKPKAVLRGVSRVFDVPLPEVMEVTGTIDIRPDDEETTLEAIRGINPILNAYAKKHPEVWDHAIKLEGSPSVASKHAAGLIITKKACKEFVPLERSKDGGFVTAWNDSAEFPIITEYMNVMKLDFLGIAGLDKQEHALQIIEERTGEFVDLGKMPIRHDPSATDPEVMKLFAEGKTLGVFQFSGDNMTRFLKSIKPDHINDLIAASALYRPGPMEMAFQYGDRKRMPADEIDYWHPILKPYLEETFGLVAYQEQVMQIVQELGMTPGDADDMRKAMGKLYRLPGQQAQKFMEGYKHKWGAGCKEKGIPDKKRDEIWKFFLNFGNYAFNKSHSASYSLQGYDDQWIKRYHPLARYASLFTGESDKEKRPALVREAREFGIEIAPPDINDSVYEFTHKGDKILYGLTAVNSVGDVAIQHILKHRPFHSMEDFDFRMRTTGNVLIKSNVRQALIDCGAFDRFGMRDELNPREKSTLEKTTLGISLSTAGSIVKYKDVLENYAYTREAYDRVPSYKSLSKKEKSDAWVQIVGEVVNVKNTKTKTKGEKMAILTLANGSDEYRCTVFPETYRKVKNELKADALMVSGYKDPWNDTDNINAQNIMDLETFIQEVT